MSKFVFLSSRILKCNFIGRRPLPTFEEFDDEGDLIGLPENSFFNMLSIRGNMDEGSNKFNEKIMKLTLNVLLDTNSYKLDLTVAYVFKPTCDIENRVDNFKECSETIESYLFYSMKEVVDGMECNMTELDDCYDVFKNNLNECITTVVEKIKESK